MADHFYVYPAYLTDDASRSLGRRVPRTLSTGPVTLDEIVTAARSLGFTVEPEPEKNYPRRPHRFEGRVKVTKRAGTTKAAFLGALAAELQKTHPAHRKGG
jgi:signal recognition particle subunit SRP19